MNFVAAVTVIAEHEAKDGDDINMTTRLTVPPPRYPPSSSMADVLTEIPALESTDDTSKLESIPQGDGTNAQSYKPSKQWPGWNHKV